MIDFSDLSVVFPPTVSVEPELVPLKASVVVFEVPNRPPPTPRPLAVEVVLLVTVSWRAKTLRSPPASTSRSPPTSALLPAIVVSPPLLMVSPPPISNEEPILVSVVVVVDPLKDVLKPPVFILRSMVLEVVVLSTMVSTVTFSPADNEASPPDLTFAPNTMISFLASRLKSPVDVILPSLPIRVTAVKPESKVCALVSFLMLPSVDVTDTFPPVIVPLVFVISPVEVIANSLSALIVPPMLVTVSASIITLPPAMTAPTMTSRVAAAR